MAEAMLTEEHRGSVPDLQEAGDEKKKGPNTRSKRAASTNKTVVIRLPPTKRRKVSSSATTIKDVAEMISTSVSPNDRDEALSTAATCFDHGEQSVHDKELEFGMDAVLIKHLGYLQCRRDNQPQDSRQNITREIGNTCRTLEMVYRGSVDSVSQAFKRNGDEVMPLLLKAIDDELCNRLSIEETAKEIALEETGGDNDKEMKKPESDAAKKKEAPGTEEPTTDDICDGTTIERSEEGDMILCKATKALGHFARVGDATKPMAYHQGLLSILINLIAIQPHDAIPAEARLNSIWILANLACNTENMVLMACHPELLMSLITIAARTVEKHTPAETVIQVLRAQSIAVRALLNLSWAPENRIPMSEIPDLIQVLSSLTVFRQVPKRGRTLADIVLQTRRQAVGTLRNLAAAPRRNKIRLCNYENGLLLNVLTDAVLNDNDEGVRQRAFATIHNLAVHDTAPMMVEHAALVLALKASHDDSDLKTFASGTLMVLERSITPDMDCYQSLRELLDAVNPSDSGPEEGPTTI